MVCAHCSSESHRTNSNSCPNYCTLCKEPAHRQKRACCKFRECNKCGASGHTASECTKCDECGSTTHKSALSFACPEHKCSNCEGTLEPKGHNRNDCPRMQPTMCEECGETGHSANKCLANARTRGMLCQCVSGFDLTCKSYAPVAKSTMADAP